MSQYSKILKKAFKNKVLYYIFSRYATYFIQFINSLFVAVYLGPYYLGIWGFITLIIQYLNQINFGISHSVNAILSIYKNKDWYVQKVIGTSLTMLIGLSFIAVLFFGVNELFNLNLGDKYNFSQYALVVVLIGILAYFNTLLSNIFRVYGKITEIAINQSAFPVLMLITILFFKGKNLLWALVWANLLAFFLSLAIYIFKSPVKLKPIFVVRIIKTIQKKGWHLFVYNTSFYLIVISTRSFVSASYTVKEFGYFTFAYALSNAVLLLLQSFSFLIYPKLLNRMATIKNDKIVELLENVRDVYITTSHLLIHLAILLFPLLILLFPQFEPSENAFKLIALTVVLYTNSFGYSGLLIAKGHEKELGLLSFLALLINIGLSIILIKIIHVSFTLTIIATMITYFIYVFFMGYIGRKKLQLKVTVQLILRDIYPVRLLIPFASSLILIFLSFSDFYFIIPVILFFVLNFGPISKIKNTTKNILVNPELINI